MDVVGVKDIVAVKMVAPDIVMMGVRVSVMGIVEVASMNKQEQYNKFINS